MGSAQSSNHNGSSNSEVGNRNPNSRLLLYVDKSSLYASTQVYAGKFFEFPSGVNDMTCGMHLNTLIEKVVNGRKLIVGTVYGTVSQASITKLRDKGIHVSNATSSSKYGRDKESNSHLTVDAVEDIILNKPESSNPNGDTVILFSGNDDMLPLIKKARKYYWNVEIWTYTSFLAGELQKEAKKPVGTTTLRICPLEEKFSSCSFYDNQEFNRKIPEDRTLLITFRDAVNLMSDCDEEKKICIKDMIIKRAKEIFKLPVAIKAIDSAGTQDIQCALIIILPENDDSTGKPYYNFQDDVINKKEQFKDSVTISIRELVSKCKVEVTKYNTASCKRKPDPVTNNTVEGPKKARRIVPEMITHNDNVDRSFREISSTSSYSYKSKYCYGVQPGRFPCKYPPGKCRYAHFRQELHCFRCGIKGDHPEIDCKKRT